MNAELCEKMLKNRPHLSRESVRVYCSVIRGLANAIGEKLESMKDIEDNLDKIMDHVSSVPYKSRRVLTSALVVLLEKSGNAAKLEQIKKIMKNDKAMVDGDREEQKKTEEEKDNWIGWDAVEEMFKQKEKDVSHIWKMSKINDSSFNELMDLVIMAVYVLIPPRRLKDYVLMKFRNIDKDSNYFDWKKKEFVFKEYKTAKLYGEQTVSVKDNKKLFDILKKWFNKNDSDYIFVNELGRPMSTSVLSHRLQRIFGGNISVNMLRKMYITDKVLAGMKPLKELNGIAEQMGHSLDTQIKDYLKRED